MKRIVLRVLLFLLIGAIVNVAAAWIIGLTLSDWQSESVLLNDGPSWPVPPPPGWPAPEQAASSHAFGFTYIVTEAGWGSGEAAALDPNRRLYYMSECSYGWPMRSLRSVFLLVDTGTSSIAPSTTIWRFGIPAPLFLNPTRVYHRFALSPLTLGFTVNSVFFGPLVGLAACGASAIRGMLRRRRNLCPHCAYPTGTSPVCTECGKPAKPRAAPAT